MYETIKRFFDGLLRGYDRGRGNIQKAVDLEYYREGIIARENPFHPIKALQNIKFVEGQEPIMNNE
jgi:hypothetical protein